MTPAQQQLATFAALLLLTSCTISLSMIVGLFRKTYTLLTATGEDVRILRVQTSNLIAALQRQKLVTLAPKTPGKDWSDDNLKTRQAGIHGNLTAIDFRGAKTPETAE